jgi:hypothetical protein
MKKFLSLTLVIIMCICTFTACGDNRKNSKEVIATVNGVEIYMSDIADDITFYTKLNNVDMSNPDIERAVVLEILNTYLIDYTCQAELDAMGMKYNSDYYGASYETLIEAYGSESKLVSFIKGLGLNKEYIENLCRKQARKATLSEYIVSKVEIPEEDILTYYIENTDAFTTEEARTMYSIYYKTEEEANAALEIINTQGFVEFFNAQNTETTNSLYHIKFESVTADEFKNSPQISEILFALPEGTYHPLPIKCNVGYVLIYVDAIKPNYTFSYDEMKEAIEEVLKEERGDQALQKFFEDLNTKYNVEIKYGQ